ncbi:hypothetical protein GQ37_022530 [Janthinobacterium sp. BJB1]|nr:hypothetical protein GQ37_022530 [Janthinobacterium sp. BJB1]
MNKGKLHSFASMFRDIERVEIPIVQRDYAQGRPEAAHIRDAFLQTLHDHLARDGADQSARLNLDFVYGSHVADRNSFAVLDGQQRLTTLFLLHWYCANKDGQFDEFRRQFACGGHSRFSYATRPSAAEFFDALVREPCTLPATGVMLNRNVVDSHWFFLSWQLDPTVQGCLNMLDAIHTVFGDCDGLYERLTTEGRITFEFLDLEHFGLSDDLYIKMNARGKPLTPFENFKAWLIGHHAGGARPEEFDRKLDQEWLDVFWNMATTTSNEQAGPATDVLYLSFFRLIALYEACERGPASQQAWLERLNRDGAIATNDFVINASFGPETLRRAALLLDYLSCGATADDLTLCCRALTGTELMPLVEFYALARAVVAACEDGVCPARSDERMRWQRVTHNLINNARVDDVASLALIVRGIDGLSQHFAHLYADLAEMPLHLVGFAADQIAEEKMKAQLILREPEWEALLSKHEQHPYFLGRVRYWLEFSLHEGAYRPGLFEKYATRAGTLLDKPVRESADLLLERALLATWDYPISRSFWRRSFCEPRASSYRLRAENWFSVIGHPKFKAFLDLLDDDDMIAGLERIIGNASCQDWRRFAVSDPGLIRYCGARLMRVHEGTIHLLSKVKSSSTHVEFYSYALYRELLRRLETGSAPAEVVGVAYTALTDGEPYLGVALSNGEKLAILSRAGKLVCFMDGAAVAPPAGLAPLLADFLVQVPVYLQGEALFEGERK